MLPGQLSGALADFCEQLQPLFEDLAGSTAGSEFLPLLSLLRQPRWR